MADYRVNLDIFAGPLDLLLYLVRKEEVDIYDIPISKITAQYIRYLDMLRSLDINVAGEFLVMAATLMHIKSAMLLPKTETDDIENEDDTDPRAQLIRQLLEYKKYKDAANLLGDAGEQANLRFPRPDTVMQTIHPVTEPHLDFDQVSVWDLLEAFDSLMAATGKKFDMSNIADDTPIDFYQVEILHRLQSDGPTEFIKVFESKPNRLVMIGLFLALLELIRENLVWAEQASSSVIYLKALTSEPAEQAVQKAILELTEADHASENLQTRPQPPIPITEQSSTPKKSHPADEYNQDKQIADPQKHSAEN